MPARLVNWKIGACLLFFGVVSVALYVWGLPQAATDTAPPARPPVAAVTRLIRTDLSEDLAVDAEFRAYQEIDVHAKVAGYLDEIHVDVGDRVRENQVLAVLEVPELQNDLLHAEAVESRCQEEIKRAQAEYEEAHLAYSRLSEVDKKQPRLIAQQDLDAAQAKDSRLAAAVSVCNQQLRVAQADVKRMKTMLAYAQITAPFSGVITKRYADPGALIQAGTSSNTQALPLVRLSQLDRLRLVFPVTVTFAGRVNVGSPVVIQTAGSNAPRTGKVSRITRRLDTATRTMDVEVDLENPDLSVFPGTYATVRLKLQERKQALAVAVEAVADRTAPTVLLLGDDNRISERSIRLGMETPHYVEVVEGLKEGDRVIFGSRAQLKTGQLVEPRAVEPSATH